MTGCSSKQRPLSECSAPTNNIQVPAVPDPHPEYEAQKQGNKETPRYSASHADDGQEMVITSIRATNVALGLQRIPANFYALVHHSDREWRTVNECLSVNSDVEWSGQIPIPTDPSATVCFGIYASFESQPGGDGEKLRELTVTVEQLLEHNTKDLMFTFFPKDDNVKSTCSNLSVTVQRQKSQSSGSAASRVAALDCELSDLDQAISGLRNAVDVTPDGHPEKPRILSGLVSFFLIRFEHLGELSDIRRAISRQRDAIDLTPDGHSNKPTYLHNLGNIFLVLFQRLGELHDLEQAMSVYRDAVDLTPDGHPIKPNLLGDLGSSFWCRFERLGELSDLEHAISLQREAVDLSPDGHPDKPLYLCNLGSSFSIRFDHLGELHDLEQAMSVYKDAVDLTPDGHPGKPARLSSLGSCFGSRFGRLGDLSDLEHAVSLQGEAVDLSPDNHPDKPLYLSNLGGSFLNRFEHVGELPDLEQAILRYRNAVNLTPYGHPKKLARLSSLGGSFAIRFKRLGELDDLEHAISRQRDAVNLTPDGHPDKPMYLNNLGNTLLIRFKRLGEPHDLEQAMSRHKDTVNLTPDGHPSKPLYLNNLGKSFNARFDHLGELHDLEQAMLRFRDAVELTPDGHPGKPTRLGNLANIFIVRFDHLGELHDLEQAMSRYKDAVDLTPDDHPEKPTHLCCLGSCFANRFERLGELSDLEHAISLQGNAVDLIPDGQPDKPLHLHNYGNSFLDRFDHLGELHDLERAISWYRDAVDLTPDGHPEKPVRLSSLGSCFANRFERLGELSDLEHAISLKGEAVDLIPDGRPDKSLHLNNLGNSFLARFEHLGELHDLEQAVLRHTNAVDLTANGHPSKPDYLSNLGNSLKVRFDRLGELWDLEQAISRCRDAVALTPDCHCQKPKHLSDLGNSLKVRFDHLARLGDLEEAISLYSQAACASTGRIAYRFRASQQWILCTRTSGHHSLPACSVAIDLLPQLAWIGLSFTHRYRRLMGAANVVPEAAAAALDFGHPETAVEWLEQGRSIVWGQLFQLRSSYEELSSVHPDHARRLQELSAALEHAGVNREKFSSSPLERSQGTDSRRAIKSLEQEADTHRMLAIERDKLLQEIRGLPGFERFLLHKEFSQLRSSAHSGPVVILNAAESRCDALIVLADVDHVIHVPLPNFTLGRSNDLHEAMKNLVRDARDVTHDEREGERKERRGVSWKSVLSDLWNGIVKPVLVALNISTLGDLSRIFWCPTGPFAFLPIHAAGLYGTRYSQPGHKVSDYVISSYVPTLSILAPSPKLDAASSGNICLLAVRQPLSDGQSPLPGVDTELQSIRTVIQNSPSARTTLLESSVGTVEEVLSLMKEADWVHFACHGVQDDENPTDSGLCLANQCRLKLSDIIALSRSRGGLAFLSACQTAKGDKILSDEAIHIAAGMLFAGYGGVIGTMWSISDEHAPRVAKDVYEQLLRNEATPDYRGAARALQEAIGHLRDSGASFHTWLPFVHVGL